ncbi:hypothetical protein cypCar_00048556 [Cyprinus carpio]|nr:hypothetical protein cypCar_00048556 [Cyprinus carpio]
MVLECPSACENLVHFLEGHGGRFDKDCSPLICSLLQHKPKQRLGLVSGLHKSHGEKELQPQTFPQCPVSIVSCGLKLSIPP